jgi:hypothetical protein
MRAKKAGVKAQISGVEAWLELEPADLARTASHFPKLEKHLSEFGLWYEEPGLTPGDWVLFEGRIGYQVMGQNPAQGAVLFCQAGGRAGPSRTEWYLGLAPYLGGCAKVTSVIDLPTLPFEVVVASPLFVRHQRP